MNNNREHYKGQFATNKHPFKILILEADLLSIVVNSLSSDSVDRLHKAKLKVYYSSGLIRYDWAQRVAADVAAAVHKARLITKPMKFKPYPPTNKPE